MSDRSFHDTWRMNKEDLYELLDMCMKTGKMPNACYNSKGKLDPKTALGNTLFYLAQGSTLRQLEKQFGFSFLRCHDIIDDTIQAIVAATADTISIPKGAAAQESSREWSEGYRFSPLRRCLFAGDGTFVPFKPSGPFISARWRCRKGFTAVNVFIGCDFNVRVVALNTGAEGSANDSMVFEWSGVSRDIPAGYFMLGDAGYGLSRLSVLTPYRTTRYHLREWGGHRPVNAQELFNLRHASRRVRVEITIGRLKARWRILRTGICGTVNKVNIILWACTSLHNFIEDRVWEDTREVVRRALDEELRDPRGSVFQADDESGVMLLREAQRMNGVWNDLGR